MRIWPIFLDVAPAYLGRAGGSLLQTPVGARVLAARLYDRVLAITPHAPVIVPLRPPGPAYRAALQAACPGAVVLADGQQLIDACPPVETSDVFLFVDPRWFPLDDSGLLALREGFSAARHVAHHLVAFEPSRSGTHEHVHLEGGGRVRSIHRYFEPATWPFVAGVAASLVPVSSNLPCLDPVPASLIDLRRQLVAYGTPSRDIAVAGRALDLTTGHGLLATAEHYVVEEATQARAAGRSSTVLVGDGHTIAPTARLLGPVVLHAHVHIGAHATIVGPALIGAGARVAAGAIVAHALVGPQSQVPRDGTLRDRVWFDDLTAQGPPRPDSYEERLARVGASPDATRAIHAGAAAAPPWHPGWKRLFDAVAAGLGLVLLAPLVLLIALLVRLESRGPIVYRSEREGLRGRPFLCLKFRTMQVGAHGLQHLLKAQDKLDGPHFKLEQDPRLTRLGRLLRSTNLDELPQLINVLRGDMSLVGPRPSPFRENQICAPWREGRLSVRPGVTGLWQVCRKDRAAGDFHQWIEYDLLYVQQASLWLDLKILVATVVTLAGRVPVPAAWLVRVPPPVPPAGAAADIGQPRDRHAPPQTEEAGQARASSRTA